MKNLACLLASFGLNLSAQIFTPVPTSNYNLDAVAENTTALATTGGMIDASDYVMYSQAYASAYGSGTGLPNSGLISAGTRSYQLQPYTQNNMLFLTAGTTDSIMFTTPALFGGISILAFATEGNADMNVTICFNDNSTQTFTTSIVTDWFGNGNAIISGFDRCGRNSGAPNLQTTQPKMFYFDYVVNCGNRQKPITNVIIQNAGTNARLCVMAVSGVSAPSHTVNTSPVTCQNGTNGSASITVSGGLPPYTQTVNTSPAQTSSNVIKLQTGVYSYTALDAALCPATGTFLITQSLVPQPSINISANNANICAGKSVTLTASGAITYTWSTSSNGPILTATPQATTVFTLSAHTIDNCFRTGSISIQVNALPVISFTTLPPSFCSGAACITLSATPAGGSFAGPGTQGSLYCPSTLPVNSVVTVSYNYTDLNQCFASGTATTILNPNPVISFSPPVTGICVNAAAVTLTASPAGGQFVGPGLNNAVFTPSAAGAGNATFTYSYTDLNNCSSTSQYIIAVYPQPVVSFNLSKTFFCKGASPIPLNASPSTGVYSGNGVSGNSFSPNSAGLGSHQISYTYQDGNKCSTVAVAGVTVSACSKLEEIEINEIEVFPVPSADDIVINATRNLNLSIIDVAGKCVRTISLDETNAYTTKVSGLNAGVYFILIEGNRSFKKIVILG